MPADPWIERIMAADRRAAILRAVASIAREGLRALGKFTHHNGGM